MADRSLPAILGWDPEPAALDKPCLCLCRSRHPEAPGVCQGFLATAGFRIHFNSMYDTEGVVVCRPCGEAMPEGLYER